MTVHRIAAHGWLLAGVVSTALIAAADGVLLEATRGGFGNGFGGVLLDTIALRAGYFALTGALDAWLLLLLWFALVPLCRWAGQPPARSLALCALSGLAGAAWIHVLTYQIHTIVGAVVTPGVVRELAGTTASSTESASTFAALLSDASAVAAGVLAAGAALTLILFAGAVRIVDRLAARQPDAVAALGFPRTRNLALMAAALGAGCAVVLAQRAPLAAQLRAAVERQPTAALLTALTNRLTDFDRDGSGWLSLPRDPAPFDGRVHGYARDAPGNDLDEDRLAGDLPVNSRPPEPITVPGTPPRRRPHVLVIYLESFRYDVLGLEHAGQSVTPFLDSLARESASSQRMFVHSPYTARSRAQLFGGSLVPQPNQRTWIDDFQSLGYRVAHFSGQDESFGDSETLLGVERADVFYDARSDTALRTSRSTAPASLQVSWKVLLRRVESFLANWHDEPLFLYVNLVDTHYPYHHDELDALVPGTPVDRSDIRSHNREQVWQTYLNAVANVDLAARKLVSSFQEAVEEEAHVIVVTGDHGQSFYEDGFLGHGHRLDPRQTQVPLIVQGVGGHWPEPLGAADLRGLLLRSLDQDRADHPEFRPDPERRIFQYMPNLERPDRIAWRAADGAYTYEFAAGTAHREDGTRVPLDDPEVVALIHAWEALRLATPER